MNPSSEVSAKEHFFSKYTHMHQSFSFLLQYIDIHAPCFFFPFPLAPSENRETLGAKLLAVSHDITDNYIIIMRILNSTIFVINLQTHTHTANTK